MARSVTDQDIIEALSNPNIRYYVERSIRYSQTRALEVCLSIIMLAYGLILLYPIPTFTSTPYRVIAAFVTENQAGSIAVALAILRLAALKRNGDGIYTPIPRIVGCVSGSMFWTALSLGFFMSIPPLTTGLAVYPVLAFAELFSARRAAADLFVLDPFNLRQRMNKSERSVSTG